MPNRILKETICNSEDINQLKPLEEITFYRLIVSCDDFGTLDARSKILKAKLYPIKDDITPHDIEQIIWSLHDAGLITLYENDDRLYLYLNKWDVHQRVRNTRSKYPRPCDKGSKILENDYFCDKLQQVAASCCDSRPESLSLSLSESLSVSLSESISRREKQHRMDSTPFDLILELYHRVCTSLPKVSLLTEERKKAMRGRWKQTGRTLNSFEAVFIKAENSDFLSGRSGKWTGCNFDWLMKSANFIKVGEGTYDSKQSSNSFMQALKELEDEK